MKNSLQKRRMAGLVDQAHVFIPPAVAPLLGHADCSADFASRPFFHQLPLGLPRKIDDLLRRKSFPSLLCGGQPLQKKDHLNECRPVFATQYQQRPVLGGIRMCSIERLSRYDKAPPFELCIHSRDIGWR